MRQFLDAAHFHVQVETCGMKGTCHGFKWMGKAFNKPLKKWNNRHNGGHDLDTNGRILVWCRKCSGYTGVKLGRKLLDGYQPFVEENKKNICWKEIQKLDGGQVPGGKELRIEGKKMRVTEKEFERLEEYLHLSWRPASYGTKKKRCEERRNERVKMMWGNVRLWLKRSCGHVGIRWRNRSKKSTKGIGRSRSVESTKEEWEIRQYHLTEHDHRKSGCGLYFFELIKKRNIRNLMRD